jgi:hypothetical protein
MYESDVIEEEKSRLEDLMGHFKAYISTSFDIVKLRLLEKGVKVASGIIASIAGAVMLLFAAVFLSVGIAWWLSDMLGNPYFGFLIVGGFYLLMGIIVMAGKKSIIETPVSNALIKQIFKEDKDHE